MCPQEGGPWGTDLWAALRYAQGFVLCHVQVDGAPMLIGSLSRLNQADNCSYQCLVAPWEKLPLALWGVGSI